MPLVKVEMLKGKSKEFKKIVLDCVHDGLMDSIGIEGWDRFQRIEDITERLRIIKIRTFAWHLQ